MKIEDIKDLTIEELQSKVNDLGHELFNLRFQNATGQLTNTANIPKTKKDISRIKTLIKQKRIS